MNKEAEKHHLARLEKHLKKRHIKKVVKDHSKSPKDKDFIIGGMNESALRDIAVIFGEMGYKVFRCFEHSHIIIGQKRRTN